MSKVRQVDDPAANSLPDHLCEMFLVMTVPEQVGERSLHGRRREAVDDGDVSVRQVATMHADAPPSLLAVGVRDLGLVVEEVAEVVEARGRRVRNDA